MARRVFISYEYYNDREFVNGIRGMLSNPNVDIDFYDESVRTPINSNNSGYIKAKIRDKIERSSVLLCIVGQDTHSSDWVIWEIMAAYNLGKKIFFMRRKDDYFSSMPPELLKLSSYRIMNWNIDFLSSF